MKDKITEKSKMFLVGLVFLLAIIPLMMNIKQKKLIKKEVKKTGIITEGNTLKHVSEGIIKKEKIQGVEFSNITLTTKDGQTTFTANVTNVTNKDIKTENFDIDLLDKNDKVVITLRANIPNGLKKHETKQVNASAKGDFKNVVSKAIKK